VSIRHRIRPRFEPRGSTPRRLAAAERALKRERDRHPLFASAVAAEQGTAEERIARFDRAAIVQEQSFRDLAARHWRLGRQWLASVNAEVREVLLAQWNASSVPADAAYFADFLRTRLRRWGIIEAKYNRHGGRHPAVLEDSEFLDADALRHAIRSTYFDATGKQIGSSRTTPARYPDVPLGAWKIERQFRSLHGHFIDQLLELDPHTLTIAEHDYTDPRCNPEGRRWDAERYACWMEEGSVPPPITVVETDSGTLRVSDGHRRTAAAKIVRQSIRAWVSWAVPLDKRDCEGTPIKTGLTIELARRMLYEATGNDAPYSYANHLRR
jgi:hypothetical protein